MKKWLTLLIVNLFLFIPNVFALSDTYVDKLSELTNTEVKENTVNIYLFYGETCPHCKKEKEWLNVMQAKYGNEINVVTFEVWNNKDNASMLQLAKSLFGETNAGVPFTVIGEDSFVGYTEAFGNTMEQSICKYLGKEYKENVFSLPIIGEVNVKNTSIPLIAIILGFIDGFNPCAMWILLFLINMLIGMNNKKRTWIYGIVFLTISGLVYFISLLGINLVLSITAIQGMKILIGIIALLAGILNLKNYIKEKKTDASCTVVDDKKRKKIFTKIKKFTSSSSFILGLIGIIGLAASVNLIELACSLGFPVIFTEILAINNITGITRIIYLLLYILFYMIDDIVVFVISVKTLEVTGLTNKYNKYSHLIGGIIMVLIGVLLIFKPDWLMLNF